MRERGERVEREWRERVWRERVVRAGGGGPCSTSWVSSTRAWRRTVVCGSCRQRAIAPTCLKRERESEERERRARGEEEERERGGERERMMRKVAEKIATTIRYVSTQITASVVSSTALPVGED